MLFYTFAANKGAEEPAGATNVSVRWQDEEKTCCVTGGQAIEHRQIRRKNFKSNDLFAPSSVPAV